MGCTEKYIPCGVVDEDSGQFYNYAYGRTERKKFQAKNNYLLKCNLLLKTSDFIVDPLEQWWQLLKPQEANLKKFV